MRPHILLLFFIIVNLHLLTAAPADDRDSDRVALRELAARYEQAINQGDLKTLASSVTPEVSAVFATNDEVQGLEAMQNYFVEIKRRLGNGSSYSVKLQPDQTQFFGDIALAHGKSDEVAHLGNGSEIHLATHWTAVLRKSSDGWKAERLHVSMDPLNNPIIQARQKLRTGWAIGLGIIACAVTFVLGRITKK